MKTYIIAGASSGIGFSIAKKLHTEGHRVIGLSRTKGRLDELEGVEYLSWDATGNEIPELPKEINGLVYCPGSIDLKPFARFDDNQWTEAFDLNVLGAVRLLRQAYPALRKSKPSSVVMFSTVAVQQGMPFHSLVSAVKGGVEGLTRALAAEWAPSIRVNAIAPSLTDTPLASKLLSSEERVRNSAERHPLKRVGTAEDQAEAASFLLSDKASWITGQIIAVDGGMSALR